MPNVFANFYEIFRCNMNEGSTTLYFYIKIINRKEASRYINTNSIIKRASKRFPFCTEISTEELKNNLN